MEPPPDRTETKRSTWLWLRRGDQIVVAVACAAALVAMVGYWFARGGHRGDLIEFDAAPPRSAKFQVDINQADWPELAALPEIGESLARRIVEYRAAKGPFRSTADLEQVSGIGAKTLATLRPYLTPLPGDAATVPD